MTAWLMRGLGVLLLRWWLRATPIIVRGLLREWRQALAELRRVRQ